MTAHGKKNQSGVADLTFIDYARHAQKWLEQNDVVLKARAVTLHAAERLNVQPFWIPIGIVGVVLICLGVFDRLITNSVGFFYPAWMSFKAIETANLDDDRQWLTYWVVYAAFSVLETLGDIVLSWVPMYYVFKIVFLLWLFLPNYQGAGTVYSRLIRPILLQHQKSVDGLLAKLAGHVEPGKTHDRAE